MTYGFGSAGGPMAPRWLVEWRRTLLIATLSVLAVFVAAIAAWAGCTILPDVEVLARRDAICEQLRLGHGCFVQPRRLVTAVIRSTETEFQLTIGGKTVGSWPMGPEAEPVDPARCEDEEWVQRRLRFHTGGPAVQDELRRQFAQISSRDVVYLDQLLQPGLRDGDACVILAQLMVVSR